MAELAVIMSMITVTSTATNVLGLIKRRCGAAQTISDLTSICAKLVEKIHELLKTLEGGAQVLNNTRGISAALNHRRDEFDAVLKNLDKMNRRMKRTHPIDRTEKFIMAQGWAKKMEAIRTDLDSVRNGIENIVTSWEAAQFVVTKFEEIVTIDVTTKKESGKKAGRRKNDPGCEIVETGSLGVDRILMTMMKLTDSAKAALNRYGMLDKLSLPDALFEASGYVSNPDSYQLIQSAAELLDPLANSFVGSWYLEGSCGLPQNIELALSHFRFASSRGVVIAMIELMEYYDKKNDTKSVFKYLQMASNKEMELAEWISYMHFAVAYKFESIDLFKSLNEGPFHCALQESICQFLGVGATKCDRRAFDVLRKIESEPQSIACAVRNSNGLGIVGTYCIDVEEYYPFLREYLYFLFKSNLFLPFFALTIANPIYSPQEWERYAFHAAKNQCLHAHVYLAVYYSWHECPREHEMKQHLRIAADAGHTNAQSLFRQLFGKQFSLSRGLKLIDKKHDSNQRKKRHRSKAKKTGKRIED